MAVAARSDADGTPRRRLERGKKVSERIAREIVYDIVSQGLQPGDRLPPETVMVRDYGVGRASLREALRILEVQGLINIKAGPGGGPLVMGSDPQHVGRTLALHLQMMEVTLEDLLEAKIQLEPMQAYSTAEQQKPEVMAKFKTIVDEMSQPDADQNRLSREFHRAVAGGSGYPVLDILALTVAHIFNERVEDPGEGIAPGQTPEEVIEEHIAISKAILAGNGARAQKLMKAHMDQYGASVRRRRGERLDNVVNWD